MRQQEGRVAGQAHSAHEGQPKHLQAARACSTLLNMPPRQAQKAAGLTSSARLGLEACESPSAQLLIEFGGLEQME